MSKTFQLALFSHFVIKLIFCEWNKCLISPLIETSKIITTIIRVLGLCLMPDINFGASLLPLRSSALWCPVGLCSVRSVFFDLLVLLCPQRTSLLRAHLAWTTQTLWTGVIALRPSHRRWATATTSSTPCFICTSPIILSERGRTCGTSRWE